MTQPIGERPSLIDALRATGRAHRAVLPRTCLCGWRNPNDPLGGLDDRSWLKDAAAADEWRAALKQLTREGEDHIFQEAVLTIAGWLYDHGGLDDAFGPYAAVNVLLAEVGIDAVDGWRERR